MFSIIIPSYNNIDYLKMAIESLKKNSFFKNEIIIHLNIGTDGSAEYLRLNDIKFTLTDYNSGICEGVNMASKLAKMNYICYAHDDFYFCPNWDKFLHDEIINIGHNKFYFSGSTIGTFGNSLECGDSFNNFNENKFLKEYNQIKFSDLQGSTWAPHVVHKSLWDKVGGFSEEFFPGAGSDPDFNMKLWIKGVRMFKSVSSSKVYHFKSKTLRKKVSTVGSQSGKIFLLKWGITIKFFKKYYLRSKTKYTGPLSEPKVTFGYIIGLIFCKIQSIFTI